MLAERIVEPCSVQTFFYHFLSLLFYSSERETILVLESQTGVSPIMFER